MNDPRIGGAEGGAATSFHFGVDISATDGTPVFAVTSGIVYVEAEHPHTVQVTDPEKTHVFGYWHLDPVVRTGMRVGVHQLLGFVGSGWGHVHFDELVDGRYVNPLRRDGLEPYIDRTSPTVDQVRATAAGGEGLFALTAVHGTVSLAVAVFDTPPVAPPGPWRETRLPPARVSWRMSGPEGVVVPPTEIVDLGTERLTAPLESVYAPETRQNRAGRPGAYWFWLARQLPTLSLPDGRYVIRVTAWDVRGNVGGRTFVLNVFNHPPPPDIAALTSTPSVIGPAEGLSAAVSFSVATNARVLATLLDATGRVVRVLCNRQVLAGLVSCRWGTGDFPSGRYELRLSASAPRAQSRSKAIAVVINRPFANLQVSRSAPGVDGTPADVTVAFTVIEPTLLNVAVVDQNGAVAATLFSDAVQPGPQTIRWSPPGVAAGAIPPEYHVVVTAADALGSVVATVGVPV